MLLVCCSPTGPSGGEGMERERESLRFSLPVVLPSRLVLLSTYISLLSLPPLSLFSISPLPLPSFYSTRPSFICSLHRTGLSLSVVYLSVCDNLYDGPRKPARLGSCEKHEKVTGGRKGPQGRWPHTCAAPRTVSADTSAQWRQEKTREERWGSFWKVGKSEGEGRAK